MPRNLPTQLSTQSCTPVLFHAVAAACSIHCIPACMLVEPFVFNMRSKSPRHLTVVPAKQAMAGIWPNVNSTVQLYQHQLGGLLPPPGLKKKTLPTRVFWATPTNCCHCAIPAPQNAAGIQIQHDLQQIRDGLKFEEHGLYGRGETRVPAHKTAASVC